mmetsp:Transcript_140262/g.355832  ORF Transcript_140262/g.355832 Transcript_140262/m.355832 type:complete len:217 (-) Transcript_140262:312-962(-)
MSRPLKSNFGSPWKPNCWTPAVKSSHETWFWQFGSRNAQALSTSKPVAVQSVSAKSSRFSASAGSRSCTSNGVILSGRRLSQMTFACPVKPRFRQQAVKSTKATFPVPLMSMSRCHARITEPAFFCFRNLMKRMAGEFSLPGFSVVFTATRRSSKRLSCPSQIMGSSSALSPSGLHNPAPFSSVMASKTSPAAAESPKPISRMLRIHLDRVIPRCP